MKVAEIAPWLQAQAEGDAEREITGVAALEDAGPDDISFAEGRRGEKRAAESRAASTST